MTEEIDRDEAPPPKHDLSALRIDAEERAEPRRRWLLWGVIAVLAIVAVLFGRQAPLPWLLPAVATSTVRRVTAEQEQTVLTATGYTYARSRAAVGSKIIGRVVELPVDEGDRVNKGDPIAILDSADLRANLHQAQASLTEVQARLVDAEREAGRQRHLVEAGIHAQATLDAAETQLEIAKAMVETQRARIDSVKAQLEYTVIASPIDGVVIERNVEVGEMVAPGGFTSQQSTGAIVRIADPTSLEVEADINESYISRLELEQPTTIQVDAVPDRSYHGRLRQIVPTADRQRAVVQVKVTIDDRDRRLVPDMSCSVTFLEEGTNSERLDRKPKLLIERTAVLGAGDEAYVFRVVERHLERALVTVKDSVDAQSRDVANRETGLLEILTGLKAGDVVVSEPSPELEDGQRVRLTQ